MLFYEPPKVIETEVFTAVPEKFRRKPGERSDTGGGKKPEKRDCFLEGPSFDRDGNLYVVDIPYGRIFRVSPSREWELVVEYDGEPNGLKIHRDGRAFVADRKHGIMVLETDGGTIHPFIEGPAKEKFKGVNDLVFARNGDLYFTDQGQTGLHDPTGRVYRYTSGGRLECLVDTVPSPNGIVLSPRENALYVAVTRANAVWVMPFDDDGDVTRAGIFVQLPSPGPDGLAIDEEGNVIVAHPGTGLAWVYDRRGVPIHQIKSCRGSMVTNVAFGGEDRKTLFLVESRTGSILTASMPAPGKLMYSHT